MKNETKKSGKSLPEKFIAWCKLFNAEHERSIKSLEAFSIMILIFVLLVLGTYIVKVFSIDIASTKSFKLALSNINILPLYTSNYSTFLVLAIIEIIKFAIAAFVFFYFIKFLKSLDKQNPFKNIISGEHIALVAILSIMFFILDAAGSFYLSFYDNELLMNDQLRSFHLEYLFLAYFLNVFAFIFKRGVDLNNEIDLVI